MPEAIEERFAGDVPSHTTGSGRDRKSQAGFHLQSSPLWGAAPPRPYMRLSAFPVGRGAAPLRGSPHLPLTLRASRLAPCGMMHGVLFPA